MTIQQTGQTLTVSIGSDSQTVNLTGAETQAERQGRNFAYTETSQARWVGSALVVTKTTVSPIGTWQDLDVFSLDLRQQAHSCEALDADHRTADGNDNRDVHERLSFRHIAAGPSRQTGAHNANLSR